MQIINEPYRPPLKAIIGLYFILLLLMSLIILFLMGFGLINSLTFVQKASSIILFIIPLGAVLGIYFGTKRIKVILTISTIEDIASIKASLLRSNYEIKTQTSQKTVFETDIAINHVFNAWLGLEKIEIHNKGNKIIIYAPERIIDNKITEWRKLVM